MKQWIREFAKRHRITLFLGVASVGLGLVIYFTPPPGPVIAGFGFFGLILLWSFLERKWIKESVERYPFFPVGLFGIGSVVLVSCVYLIPPPGTLIPAFCGLGLFLLFFLFLLFYRKGNRAAIGSTSAPNIIGPFLAHFYVKLKSAKLYLVLADGGDHLIQLAFFFASLIAALLYVFVSFDEMETYQKIRKQKIYIGFLFLVLLLVGFGDLCARNTIAGHPLAFGIDAPNLTFLTLCRMLLALSSVVVACWPGRNQPVVQSVEEASPPSPK